MKVSILKRPTEEDWLFCKQCALVTIGKDVKTVPGDEWKRSILRARHSPIRELRFAFLLENIPYWVSVHLCRHVHAQPYVRSQRNDRQVQYDRGKAPQDAPVSMIWTMNAEMSTRNSLTRWCRCVSGRVNAMKCTHVEVVDENGS